MRIAVVGCGVAGMGSALALARRGHDVVVFEAFPKPRPVGSGLLLQPTGLAALRELGLLEEACDYGAKIETLDGRDEGGRRVMNMHYRDWRPEAFGLGIHRAALFTTLFNAMSAHGVRIMTGRRIVSLTEWRKPILHEATGEQHGPFDLVVCADGSGSGLRRELRPRARARNYAWGAVWVNALDNEQYFSGALHQRYVGASIMAGVLPVGRVPGEPGRFVSIFWSLPATQINGFLSADLGGWAADITRLWPETERLVSQLNHGAEFSPAYYRDVQVGRWDRGAALLVGDAAHGTSPQLGQGANLALVDAVELADHLTRASPRSLRAYQIGRRRHTGLYQFISRHLTPMFQSDGWLGPALRRWAFTPLSQTLPGKILGARILTGAMRLGRTPRNLRP